MKKKNLNSHYFTCRRIFVIYTIRLKTCKKKKCIIVILESVLLLNGSNNDGTNRDSNRISNIKSNIKSDI